MDPIERYFLIGDLHSAALVSSSGSIDWLCWPHFDSTSIFGSILDRSKGNFTAELSHYQTNAEYIERTAIVQTEAKSETHHFILRDFMLPQEIRNAGSHFLIRKIINKAGKGLIRFVFNPKPLYGKDVSFKKTNTKLSASVDGHNIILHLPSCATASPIDNGWLVTVDIKDDAQTQLVLEYSKDGTHRFKESDFDSITQAYWHNWVFAGNFSSEKLIRSAISLKLMQYYTSGGLIAAPTTSLPESIGGKRNWDYRYVWLRDATFALYALHTIGYTAEAKRFLKYVEHAVNQSTKKGVHIELFYTITGKQVPHEIILDWDGYLDSTPVRIGNNAVDQWQLDVYGTLLDTYYFVTKRNYTLTQTDKHIIEHLVKRIEQKWMEKDQSIWEVRGPKRHYTYSKVLCWVGINRVLRMKKLLGYSESKIKALEALQMKISRWIWTNCYKDNKLVQHPDSKKSDATNFLFVLLHFLDRDDRRTKEIFDSTTEDLVTKDVFVKRYVDDDGFKSKEGSFLLCSFWYISALAIMGDKNKGRTLLETLETYFNPQELLPEEIDPETGAYLGNYPQAFSHMGYLMAKHYLRD